MMSKVFYAYRSTGAFFGIGIGFLILAISIGLPLLFTQEDQSVWRWELLVPGILVLFFAYVLTASLLKLFTCYRVHTNGITLYKPPFHWRLIAKDAIENIEYLDSEDTANWVAASIQEQESYSDSADIVGYVQMLRKEFPAYRYFTIAPSANVSSIDPTDKTTSLQVKLAGGMIILRLKDSEEFFLTPQNPLEFKSAVDAIL